jgi:exopolyphosphatase/guanosine-5'-triphosphate,3'-diphosphate pyrophosphatase
MSKEIIPRWEWRTFGDNFAGSENPFAAFEAGDAQDSDEIYFLSPVTSENVKVRDGLMDIKKFQRANPDGLEQWKPVLKHGFPLPASDASTVFEILGISSPKMARQEYTLEQFIQELITPVAGMRLVNVHKTRTRYTVDGCMAEVADVVADGKRIRTIAMELEDPAQVIATVRQLGLDRYENISYPRGLKRLVGMTS